MKKFNYVINPNKEKSPKSKVKPYEKETTMRSFVIFLVSVLGVSTTGIIIKAFIEKYKKNKEFRYIL